MKRLILLMMLGSVWLLAGIACTPDTPHCIDDSDCTSDRFCVLGTCEVTQPCGQGKACNPTAQPNTPTPKQVCTPGEKACSGNTLSVCAANGLSWNKIDCGVYHKCEVDQCIRKARPDTCGNGYVEANEQCDDGNVISGDGCSSYCLKETIMRKEPPIVPGGIQPVILQSYRCRNAQNRERSQQNNIPLYIKVSATVCRTGGRPVVSAAVLQQHIAYINRIFARSRLVFVLWETRYEDNANYCEVFYDTESGPTIHRYQKSNMISVFYARNISGGNFAIGGFANLSGVVMNASAYGMPDILAHELGHSFGLDHPHACDHGRENPSNCSRAGDQLCDTPADPGPAGVNGLDICSDGRQKNGACVVRNCQIINCPGNARPDIRNLMSYYDCGTQLTNDQVKTLRCLAYYDQARRVTKQRPCRNHGECGGGQCVRNLCTTSSNGGGNGGGNTGGTASCTTHPQCGGGKRCKSGQCVACLNNGVASYDASLCCGGTRDGRGRCCTGAGCCGPTNNSHFGTDGKCRCNGGYTWATPSSSSDFRCKAGSGSNNGGNNGGGTGGGNTGTCKANGTWASSDAECCGKQRDDRGKCCSGTNCCKASNNSYTSHTGGCQCKAGFKWVNTQNVRNDKRCFNPNSGGNNGGGNTGGGNTGGTCIKDGQKAPNPASCCSKDRSDQGICCTGGACCGKQTNSWTVSSGACQCRPGFTRVNPNNPKDFRCR